MSPLDILIDRRSYWGPGNTENSVQAHYLVILLPFLTKDEVSLCSEYSDLNSHLEDRDELLQVVRRKVSEYLEVS